ncbi:MAG: histidine phosphatase family protein [Brooklawnia sp.]|uniref:histidine phosphatase family protein n=1 Tax=Brooklawnia sp. TaxID=2699740 RepID=UPI003C74BF1D
MVDRSRLVENPDSQASSAGSLAADRRLAPSELVLVRHAKSVGNLADERARKEGRGRLELETRDADTPLAELGEEQAAALGRYLRGLDGSELPDVVLSSPYERARHTAEIALETAGLEYRLVIDERLRERDLGVWDGLTRKGIEEKFPEEAARRTRVGKFYYRAAGGESWCDVALRVRSVLSDIRTEYDSAKVWVFSHQAVIMSFRLVLESLDEATLLGIDAENPLPNVSLTSYRRRADGALHLAEYARTTHLSAADVPATAEPPAAKEQP